MESTMLMQTVSSDSVSSSEDPDLSYNPEHKSDGSSSPTDVRSYRHNSDMIDDGRSFNDSLARLGDLPIVREGSILNEDEDNDILMNGGSSGTEENYHQSHSYDIHPDDIEDEEEITDQYREYEREQEELQREMNLNKIAFAAYRNAVLHLVHNQASFTKSTIKKGQKGGDDEDFEDEDDGSRQLDDNETVDTQDEANLRMTVIEEIAKDIVETKAKACFDAVVIAQEFSERREAKRQRGRMLLGGLAGVGGEDNILSELRKMKKITKERKEVDTSKGGEEELVKAPPVEKESVSKPNTKDSTKEKYIMKKSTKAKPKKKDSSGEEGLNLSLAGPIIPPLVGPIVRLRKKQSRHPDCIKATLPKFQPKEDEEKENGGSDNKAPSSGFYGTTSWIRKTTKWRIERDQHEEGLLTKCGCPDCLGELKIMYDKKKAYLVK